MGYGGALATDSEQPALTLDFSTDDLPVAGRLAAIRDYMVEFMRVEIGAVGCDSPLHYSANLRTVNGTRWGSAYPSSIMSMRTNQLAKDGQDDLLLTMPEVDLILQIPGKADMLVGPGEALLLSSAREMRFIIPGSGRLRCMVVPHRAIAQILPRISSAPVMHIRSNAPMLSLLFRYVALLEEEPLIGSMAQLTAVRHLQEMLALVVGASDDFQEQAERDTVAAARMLTVRAAIAEHLGNTNLGIRWIAAQQQVTPRHLQRLFAEAGTSFTDILREARLARARSLLEDPSHADRTIVSIALECGFPEASALNRLFRQKYGMTPSEARWRR